MAEMYEIDIEHLIVLVSQNQCLWDKSLEDYHNRTATTEAWRIVCKELNPSFEEMSDTVKTNYGKTVLKKWRNIRDQWMKTTKKVDSQKRSGAAATHAKYYVYHEQLSFFKKNTAANTTASSYTDDPELSGDIDSIGIDESDTPSLPRTKTKAPTPAEKEGARKKLKVDVEKEILASLSKDDDPNLSFFKGILPRMSDFTEDELLQFQCGVLNLIQNIKRSRIAQPPTTTRSFTTQPSDHFNFPSTSFQGWSHSTSQQWGTHSQQPSSHLQRPQCQATNYTTGSFHPTSEDSESPIYDLDFGNQVL